jgi:hypothetical protein
LTAFLTFSIQIGDLYGKTANHYEVEYGLLFVQERIEAALLRATDVDEATTVTGVSAGALGLTVNEVSSSPLRFYLNGGVLYFQEGAETPLALTSDTILVDSFQVTLLESAIDSKQIQIDGQFSTLGVDRVEMSVRLPFHWTFTLRAL